MRVSSVWLTWLGTVILASIVGAAMGPVWVYIVAAVGYIVMFVLAITAMRDGKDYIESRQRQQAADERRAEEEKQKEEEKNQQMQAQLADMQQQLAAMKANTAPENRGE
jgi:uncharacterized membrane protein (DUF106 family)